MIFLNLPKKDWLRLLCFFALVFIIYAQSLSGNFVFDDRNLVNNTALLSNFQNIGQVAMHPFWSAESGLYRPTTLLSYTLNFMLLGGSPGSFHFVNLVLYFLICALIYLFIKKLFKNEALAFITALLFLLLPIHTEVVANISGRGELLALLFSLFVLLEFATEKEINFWRAGLWMLLAMGSKETAIATLPLALIILCIREGKTLKINLELAKKYFKSISAIIIAVCFYFFLRFFSLGPANYSGVKTSLIENPLIFTELWSRIATAFKILWMYVEKTFWPASLCSDYSYNQIPIVHNFFNLESILGFTVFLISIVFIFIYLKKKPIIAFSASIFVFSFLPVSNILFPIGTIAGERLFFFPSLGFCLITAFILHKLFIKLNTKNLKIVLILLCIIPLVTYGFIGFKRQSVWQSEESLFLSAAKCAPNSVLSRSNSGAIYLLKGDLEKARKELELARSIKPIYSKGLNNLGLVYWKIGENKKAEEMYHAALMQDFPYDGTYENLALLYLSEGKIDLAKHWLTYLYPNNEDLVNSLIKNYIDSKKDEIINNHPSL